jgi:hypothetical protein
MQILRSILAVLAGLVLISVIVESLEFGLVTLVNGEVTTDPDSYLRVRNTPGLFDRCDIRRHHDWLMAPTTSRAGSQAAAPTGGS